MLQFLDPVRVNGKVTQIIGLTVESEGPDASVGDVCVIHPIKGGASRFRRKWSDFAIIAVLLMPLGELQPSDPGCDVVAPVGPLSVQVGSELLGKVLDGLGQPLDGTRLPDPHAALLDAPNAPAIR